VAKVGPDNLLPRLDEHGSDEFGQLAQALNRMFERLAQSESRDQLILDSINDGFFELDRRGRITTLNRGLEQMLGYSRGEILGHAYTEVLAAEDIPRTLALLTRIQQDRTDNQFAATFKRRDGSLGHFETRPTLFHDRQGQIAGCRGILRDTSEQMAYQNKLIDMAYRDPLTNLGNRKAFSEELQRSLELMQRQERSLALLYIDLDRFKQVNDQYGHDIGDALLISIAQRLQGSLRQPDHVYRLGGDEFTVLLTNADAESALKLAERLLSSLGQPFIDERLVIDFVTPSIGIALYPQHARQAESLIKAADIAMYEAKQQRNRACLYSPPTLPSPPQSR
jgi:diguanylate cyclase (GGDEF)-like protein/PAS domain S-box-containing protein